MTDPKNTPSEEELMEKYGVAEGAEGEALEKKANAGCPVEGCGVTPERHGMTLMCPVHGSEPFE